MNFDFTMTKNGEPRRLAVSHLRRDVFVVVFFKVCIIVLAAFTLFGASHRLQVDADVMTTHLMR